MPDPKENQLAKLANKFSSFTDVLFLSWLPRPLPSDQLHHHYQKASHQLQYDDVSYHDGRQKYDIEAQELILMEPCATHHHPHELVSDSPSPLVELHRESETKTVLPQLTKSSIADDHDHEKNKEGSVMIRRPLLSMDAPLQYCSPSRASLSLPVSHDQYFKHSLYCVGESSRSMSSLSSFAGLSSDPLIIDFDNDTTTDHLHYYSSDSNDKSCESEFSFSSSTITSTTTTSIVSSSTSKQTLGTISMHYSKISHKYYSQVINPKPIKKDHSSRNIFSSTIRSSYSGPDQNPHNVHPLMEVFRVQELSKQVIASAVPITMGIIVIHHNDHSAAGSTMSRLIVLLLSVGVAALWNGNLLQHKYPSFGHRIQLIGCAFVLGAFFGLISCCLWPSHAFLVPIFCWIISLLILGKGFLF